LLSFSEVTNTLLNNQHGIGTTIIHFPTRLVR
jgi:hypothetical protein